MQNLIKAKEPFRFCTRLHLSELTGLKAANLGELLKLVKEAPDSCIYHHTHRFLQQHQYLSPEPPNDFAYWVNEVLGERGLGEKLLNIDTIQYSSIGELRERIALTIEEYLRSRPLAIFKFARSQEEFHFIKSISFIIPTDYLVYDLKEFKEILKKVTIDSVYFHVFEARLRLGRKTNDFSNWIEFSLGEEGLADKIFKLNPYTYTLEELRSKIISLAENDISPL
ncbi:MAG: DUF5752 family protein [Candidatus Omnitrophota bacterium]|nr:DUF5752 family protein [Candidatus Omnitrophota bacterium]